MTTTTTTTTVTAAVEVTRSADATAYRLGTVVDPDGPRTPDAPYSGPLGGGESVSFVVVEGLTIAEAQALRDALTAAITEAQS